MGKTKELTVESEDAYSVIAKNIAASIKKDAGEEIFWLDNWKGEARSGYFVRSDLFGFFRKCEEKGIKIVGIKKPTDWNLEFIAEVQEKPNEE